MYANLNLVGPKYKKKDLTLFCQTIKTLISHTTLPYHLVEDISQQSLFFSGHFDRQFISYNCRGLPHKGLPINKEAVQIIVKRGIVRNGEGLSQHSQMKGEWLRRDWRLHRKI